MSLEKHWDFTYKREYFFNPATEESIWDLPEDNKLKIVDRVPKKVKEELELEKKRQEYREKKQRIQDLQNENLK